MFLFVVAETSDSMLLEFAFLCKVEGLRKRENYQRWQR